MEENLWKYFGKCGIFKQQYHKKNNHFRTVTYLNFWHRNIILRELSSVFIIFYFLAYGCVLIFCNMVDRCITIFGEKLRLPTTIIIIRRKNFPTSASLSVFDFLIAIVSKETLKINLSRRAFLTSDIKITKFPTSLLCWWFRKIR